MSENDETPSLKEVTLLPVVTHILRPSAKLLGAELRELLQTTIERIKDRKRNRNIEYHLEKIRRLIEERKKDKRQHVQAIDEEKLVLSIDGIEDVDPEHTELSSLWHHLIANIATGGSVEHICLEALKALNSEEARILLQFTSPRLAHRVRRGSLASGFRDQHFLNTLIEKSLVKRIYWTEITVGFLVVTGFIFWMIYERPLSANTPYGFPDRYSLAMFLMAATGVMLGGTYLLSRRGIGKYQLTWLGKELLKHASVTRESPQTSTRSTRG